MAKEGFKGQWVEIARAGKAVDSRGVDRDLSHDFLSKAIANYSGGQHEAPIVIGHPENDTAPAFGWVSEARLNGDILEARFSDTDDEFEQLVENGRYKKRSTSFYLDPPNIRHLAFLGGQPPAIKGLRDIQFADGEAFTVESIINLQEKTMEEKDLDQMPESFWEKIKTKLGIGTADLSEKKDDPQGASTSFSEADLKKIIGEAVESATADFKEQIGKLETANADLARKVDGQVAGSAKAEIASFVESIPAEKGKAYLKRAGIAEFMESLVEADAADGETKAISFSEGEGSDKVDHKFSRVEWFKQLVNELPAMIQFGEKFGSMTATVEAGELVDNDRITRMNKAAGVKTEGGAN